MSHQRRSGRREVPMLIRNLRSAAGRCKRALVRRETWIGLRLRILRRQLPAVQVKVLMPPDITDELEPILDDIFLPPYYWPGEHDDFSPLIGVARLLRPETV